MIAPGIAELAAGLSWRESDRIAMIWAYYDESGEYSADGTVANMSIGCCVAPLSKWKRLDDEWRRALAEANVASFHMTDFEAWKPPFDFKLHDGSRDVDRHKKLLNTLLTLMLEHVECFAGFAAGNVIASDTRAAHGSSLEDCIRGAMSHAVQDLWDRYGESVHMVFDRQKHVGHRLMQEHAEQYNWGFGAERIGSLSTNRSDAQPALQTADILAFEMAKTQRNHRERYPFRTLLDGCIQRGLPMTLKWGPFTKLSERKTSQLF